MPHTTFDFAGHTVQRVGFGAMQLPGTGVMGPPKDHDAAIAVLRRAVELGVNHIDTAEYYGPHVSNELIREALHPYGADLALVSKVGAVRGEDGSWIPAQEPAQLREGVQDNLRTLGVDQLAAVNLRLMPADEHPELTLPALEDQLAEMAALRDDGLIVGIGLSTATLEQVRQAHESVGLDCVQNAFSLVDQRDHPTLDYCRDHDIAYAPYFPLGSAIPGMAKVGDQQPVIDVAARLGFSAAQVGLAWLLALAPNVLVIAGTSSVEHLEQNLACADVELSADDIAELNTAAGNG